MAEIEYMAFARAAIAIAVAVERTACFAADRIGFRVQRDRVEVALERNLATGAAGGIAEVDRPVDAHRFGAAGCELFDIRCIALAEQDQWRALRAFAARQFASD